MPNAIFQHRIGRWFHTGAGAADTRLGQLQLIANNAVILFPAYLLDRMRPGQGKGLQWQCDHYTGCRQAQLHHAATGSLRFCQPCHTRKASASMKPIWSVSGIAATSNAAAMVATVRSAMRSGAQR